MGSTLGTDQTADDQADQSNPQHGVEQRQKRMKAIQAQCMAIPHLHCQLPRRYVCGIAKCSLAGLATGAKHLELHSNVMPYTTVRGAAGLEWSSRPGRYVEVSRCLQADCQLSVHVDLSSVHQVEIKHMELLERG